VSDGKLWLVWSPPFSVLAQSGSVLVSFGSNTIREFSLTGPTTSTRNSPPDGRWLAYTSGGAFDPPDGGRRPGDTFPQEQRGPGRQGSYPLPGATRSSIRATPFLITAA
jgi:hypothetical protein